MARISVKGIKELSTQLRTLNDRVGIENMRTIFVDAIDLVREQALANLRQVTTAKTGNLEQSLITRPGKNANRATAWTKAGGRLASHAHLIEYGHRIVGHKPNKTDAGQRVIPHPFFRPALIAKRAAVRRKITDNLRALVQNKGLDLQIGRVKK